MLLYFTMQEVGVLVAGNIHCQVKKVARIGVFLLNDIIGCGTGYAYKEFFICLGNI